MDAQTKTNQNNAEPPKKKWQKHSEALKKKIVLAINQHWAEGGALTEACTAHSISHYTYWKWRKENPEFMADYERANTERHEVKGEIGRAVAFEAIEYLAKPELRTRTIKKGRPDKNGKFQVTEIVVFEEYKEPNWPAVRELLYTYAPEIFNKDLQDNTVRVIFADDATNTDSENSRSETEE